MKIGFIGAGKVGISFGIYLKNKGFDISGYYSKTKSSTVKGATATESIEFSELRLLVEASDLIFITTKDGEISKVAKEISDLENFEGRIFIHMSGAHSSSILSPLRKNNCCCYSLHPLQVFSGIESAVEKLDSCYFSLEGDVEKINVIEEILQKLDNKYFVINEESKTLYHAAACVFSNYITATMWVGEQILSAAGIDFEENMEGFHNLIMGAVNDSISKGSASALTGPIARGDYMTLKNHLEDMHDEQLKFRYKTLGLLTLELAKIKVLKDSEGMQKIKEILGDVYYER
jgi:predicted short-subunit dehydrogenase-like oxidoreductase (DUF2520 family)